jgi:hypothetical protein
VWDRLFGTFQEEEEKPVYGITKPLNSWNPVYANFVHYIDLFRAVAKARSAGDGVRMLFRRPGWMPDYLGGYRAPHAVPATYRKYDISVSGAGARFYVAVQFTAAMVTIALYLRNFESLDLAVHTLGALWIVATTVMFSLVFERRRVWVSGLEIARLATIPAALVLVDGRGPDISSVFLVAAVTFAAASAGTFLMVFRSGRSPAPDVVS